MESLHTTFPPTDNNWKRNIIKMLAKKMKDNLS